MIKKAIEILFPNTKNVDEVVKIINKYKDKFRLNTDIRLYMFLAQVREEIGSEFKVVRENLNYSSQALLKTFKSFTPELASKYGRTATKRADPVQIANIAYANKLGNGSSDSNGDGVVNEYDDGWKYRGAGCLQITGKSNFTEVQKRCVRYAGKEFDPDTLEGFIVFGMAYWIWRDCYLAADTGDIDKVTAIINRHTSSYASRKDHYNKIKNI